MFADIHTGQFGIGPGADAASVRNLLDALQSDRVIPDPFDLGLFIDRIGARLGRRIHVASFPTRPDAPCGSLISTHDTDHILHADLVSPFHRDHIIAHELGHLLLQHDSSGHDMSGSDLSRLMPDLDPAVIRRLLGRRTGHASRREHTAEVFATLLLSHPASSTERARQSRREPPHQQKTCAGEPDEHALRESLHRLLPLWSSLTKAVPHVVVSLDGGLSAHSLPQRLHRCLVEINDALLVLTLRWVDRIAGPEVLPYLAPARPAVTVRPSGEPTMAPPHDAASAKGSTTHSPLEPTAQWSTCPPAILNSEIRRLELLSMELQRSEPGAAAFQRAGQHLADFANVLHDQQMDTAGGVVVQEVATEAGQQAGTCDVGVQGLHDEVSGAVGDRRAFGRKALRR